ncbi:hypothetical protein ACOXXX_20505 [Thalassococcus sp. BH17M4-6]|uniref:hypothetical protein n=1 Tax=Thalassococcus sp. BH17M4-6 TaxID=3413148 RepID=UPI003BCDADB6
MTTQDWAVIPLRQKEAAAVIGHSYGRFSAVLDELEKGGVKTCAYRGTRRVFYPQHIQNIKEALECRTPPKKAAGKTAKSATLGTRTGSKKQATGQSISSSTDKDFDAALAYALKK